MLLLYRSARRKKQQWLVAPYRTIGTIRTIGIFLVGHVSKLPYTYQVPGSEYVFRRLLCLGYSIVFPVPLSESPPPSSLHRVCCTAGLLLYAYRCCAAALPRDLLCLVLCCDVLLPCAVFCYATLSRAMPRCAVRRHAVLPGAALLCCETHNPILPYFSVTTTTTHRHY